MIRPRQRRIGDWPGKQILSRCLGEYERSHDDDCLDFLVLMFIARFNDSTAILNATSFQNTLNLLKLAWFGFKFHSLNSLYSHDPTKKLTKARTIRTAVLICRSNS